jgi:dTDP-4-dehydrorhamnose reductase
MKKIIIVGSNGMLGRYMTTYLKQYYTVVGLTRYDYDIAAQTNKSVKFFTDTTSPGDVVINCAGILKPYYKTLSFDETYLVNAFFPSSLSHECIVNNRHFIHFSSDCVFGDKGDYVETDEKDGYGEYARQKGKEPLFGVTFRTSFIGEQPNHTDPSTAGLLQWLRLNNNTQLNGYTNCLWNGLTCYQVCKIVKDTIDERYFGNRTQHLFTPEKISKHDLCKLIIDEYDLNIDLVPTEAGSIMGTPIHGVLDRTLSTIHEPIKVPDIKTQINEQHSFKL